MLYHCRRVQFTTVIVLTLPHNVQQPDHRFLLNQTDARGMTVLGCLLESPHIKQTALETAASLIEHGAATQIQIGPDGTPLLSHCINQGIHPGPAFEVLFGECAPGAELEDPHMLCRVLPCAPPSRLFAVAVLMQASHSCLFGV